MSETPKEDVQDLWSIYQTTKAQYAEAAAYKTALLSALTTLLNGGAVDASAFSDGGEGGSESISVVSLTARYDSAVAAEERLFDLLEKQRLLAVKATPGFGVAKIATIGSRRGCL